MPHVDGPVYGTPFTLALVEPKLEEHGIDATDRLHAGPAARPRHGRPVRDRVHPRHAQHAGLRRAGDPHAGRASSSTPATSRSTRRRSTASTSTCIASRELGAQGVLALLRRQHEHRPPRLHRVGDRRHRRVRGDLHQRAPEARRRDVLVEHLPDADARGPGGAVRPQGGVRRPRDDRELRRSPSGSATCGFRPACRSAIRDVPNYPRAGRALPDAPARRASRMSALPRIAIDDHRHVKLGRGRHGRLLGPGHSRATRRRSAA